MFGHQLFELGRLEEARIIFEGLVSTNARDGFAHSMLGTIELARGELKRALALFEGALEVDPNDLAALVYRGEIRLNQKKPREALIDLERAMARCSRGSLR
jgi:tetratricopeptide (TPR) repeat protein